MARYRIEDQLQEILLTDLYNSGETFTIPQMAEKCTTVKHTCRMNELLRLLMEDGYIQSKGSNVSLVYRKSLGEKWIRKKWLSEVAEDLCYRDYCGNLSGKTSLDVRGSTETLSRPC
jgi:hypothetical protein